MPEERDSCEAFFLLNRTEAVTLSQLTKLAPEGSVDRVMRLEIAFQGNLIPSAHKLDIDLNRLWQDALGVW